MANWHDKYYKYLLIVPAIILTVAIFQLYTFQQQTGDIIRKDVTLTGGTTITVFDRLINIENVEASIIEKFPDIKIRALSDFRTGEQRGFIIETKAEVNEIRPALEDFLGYELTQENSSIEFSGATLSQGFYVQLRSAIVAALLLMGWVVFQIFGTSKKIKGITLMLTATGLSIALSGLAIVKFISVTAILIGFVIAMLKGKTTNDHIIVFGTIAISLIVVFMYPLQVLLIPIIIILLLLYGFYSIPSIAVIVSAFADIIMSLAAVNFLGLSLSTAGVIAFLLIIGYSVDTDILLTNRMLERKEGSINERLKGAFKTGMTMTLTSIAAIGVSLYIVYNSSDVLRQMFTIIIIGLGFDLVNTWFTNASILKWYIIKKEKE